MTDPSPSAGSAAQILATTRVQVRMYCLGTGDCLVLKFQAGDLHQFTMLVDCGSCVGNRTDFLPYIQDLVKFVDGKLDLLVVTHEHQDHVNGFDKCYAEFEQLEIGQAWFAWTEDPDDPDQRALDLLTTRQKARLGLHNALLKLRANRTQIEQEQVNLKANKQALVALDAFLDGMDTLGSVNLEAADTGGQSLAGMRKIKQLLRDKKVQTRYLKPGTSLALPLLPGVRFHVLGPSLNREHIYANGKEGRDTHRRHEMLGEGLLAMNSFATMEQPVAPTELPFSAAYVVENQQNKAQKRSKATTQVANSASGQDSTARYLDANNTWRTIENEWLYTAGSLAIRLDSHINNTSLALAVELGVGGPVMLLPGDAEYANWAGWHQVEQWQRPAGENARKPFVEDLLNRTVFYKVSHHLSFNGTPLDKGIRMMNHPDLAVMVTLDRARISSRWLTTMPNKRLLQELISRSQNKCIVMNDLELTDLPGQPLDTQALGEGRYEIIQKGGRTLAKQYTVLID